jgi:chromosome segregation ATPase
MPNNDDIDDLPSLMPDSDEIKGAGKSSVSSSRSAADEPVSASSAGVGRTNVRENRRSIAPPRKMNTSGPQVIAKQSLILWMLVLAMCVGILGGGYWAYNKLTDVDLLLTVSRGELDHARKRIGELEALVVATDVNANKSGTVVQAQVRLMDNRAKERNKFVDTEIDKLWGVTYRNNRPAIEENQKAIENNTTTLKQHQEMFVTQTDKVDKQKTLASQQQLLIQEAGQTSQLAMQSVNEQLNKVQLLQDTLSTVLKQIKEQDKALSDQHKADIAHAQLAEQLALQRVQDLSTLNATIASVSNQLESSKADEGLIEVTNRIDSLENNSRVLTAIEQNASEMDERVYLVEESIDSVNSFRRDTNRKLDQLQNQIRNLAYSE